jgi:hypothetical protein
MKLTKVQRSRGSSSSELSRIPLSSSLEHSSFDSNVATDSRSTQDVMRMHSQPPARTHPRYAVSLVDVYGPFKDLATAPLSSSTARLSALRRVPASDVVGLPQSYSEGRLHAVPSFEGPDERHLDADPAQSPAIHNSVDTSARNEAVADVADSIMTPPIDFYNATEDTYTLHLDWMIDRIGASEFYYAEATPGRKLLRHISQYRELVRVLPGGIFAWLCGRPLMVVMQFPADWYRRYTPVGGHGKSQASRDHGIFTDISQGFVMPSLAGMQMGMVA